MIALLLALTIPIHLGQRTEFIEPAMSAELQLDGPTLRFAGPCDAANPPSRVWLRLINPTADPLFLGLGPDRAPLWVHEAPHAEGATPKPGEVTLRFEVEVDHAWVESSAEYRRAEVPPRSAWQICVPCPPAEVFRVRARMDQGDRPFVLVTEPFHRDILIDAHPTPDGLVTVEHLRTDEGPYPAHWFLLNNPTDRSVRLTGWDVGGIRYSVQHPADGAWIDERRTVCGVGLKSVFVPPRRAMAFRVRTCADRQTLRVGVRVDGEQVWSAPIEQPPLCPPVEPDEPEGPVRVSFEAFHLAEPLTWWRLTNPTREPLTLEGDPVCSPRGHVAVWVEQRQPGPADLRPRLPSYPWLSKTKTCILPPRTCCYFIASMPGERGPIQVGVRTIEPEGTRMIWSSRFNCPPSVRFPR